MDVPSLASKHESDADPINQSSYDCQEISDILIDSNHQETGGAIEGKTNAKADHLPLFRHIKFGCEGVGDEQGDTLNSEVHRT